MIKRFAILAVVLALVSCSTKQTQVGILTATKGLDALGQQFVAVSGVYSAQCLPAVRQAALGKFCAAFKEYAPKFQVAYKPAVDAIHAAASANDTAKLAGAQATIIELSTSLTAIAAEVLMAVK